MIDKGITICKHRTYKFQLFQMIKVSINSVKFQVKCQCFLKGAIPMHLSKKLIIIVSSILVVIAIAASIYFVNQNLETQKTNIETQKTNEQTSFTYQKQFNLPKDEVDSLFLKYKNWDTVNQKILEKKYIFSSEALATLSGKGYPQADIAKAQQYASRCKYTAEQILKTRGLPGKKQISWTAVIKRLKIDMRSESEVLGLTKEEKLKLKQFNLGESELVNIAVLKLQKKRTVDEIFNQLKLGESVEHLVAENR